MAAATALAVLPGCSLPAVAPVLSVDLALQLTCGAPGRITVELFNVSEHDASRGPIVVLVPRNSGDPILAGQHWQLDAESDPAYIRVWTNTSIAAGGAYGSSDNISGKNATSTFELACSSTDAPPENRSITLTVADGSGADTNNSNNSATTGDGSSPTNC